MGIAVCQGDPFLGFATSKSKVLYLALEDPRRRIKKRAWKLLDETTGELHFATAADKVASGLIPQVEDHLASHPGTRLVIVDTFQMVREPSRESAYAADYADLSPLKRLADGNSMAVVVVHHTRKMGDSDVFNTVSGTTGITGCADSTMVLSNVNRADGNATLSIAGRDREFMELKVRFRQCRWNLVEVTSQAELEERDVPDDVLRTIDFMTGRAAPWQGTATGLLEAVGAEGVSVAAFGKHLAQHAGFMLDRGVEYRRQHTRAGTILTLARADAVVGDVGAGRVLVLDRTTMLAVAKEMRAWGRHYNQAVHALNVMAKYLRNAWNVDGDDVAEQLVHVRSKLDSVMRGQEDITARIDELCCLDAIRGR